MDIELKIGGVLQNAYVAALANKNMTSESMSIPSTPNHHRTYKLSDWREDIVRKRFEFQTYRSTVLADSSIPQQEKERLILEREKEFADVFLRERRTIYSKYRYSMGVPHSCTKKSSGGTKRCGSKSKTVPIKNLYTKEAWVRAWSRNSKKGKPQDMPRVGKGERSSAAGLVRDNGRTIATVSLRKSGKGRKIAYTLGVFRIRSISIEKMIRDELDSYLLYTTYSPI